MMRGRLSKSSYCGVGEKRGMWSLTGVSPSVACLTTCGDG